MFKKICIYKNKCLVIDKLKPLSFTMHKLLFVLFIDLDFIEYYII